MVSVKDTNETISLTTGLIIHTFGLTCLRIRILNTFQQLKMVRQFEGIHYFLTEVATLFINYFYYKSDYE